MRVSLVVPVFNEDAAIHVFYKEVMRQLDAYELEIIFIDDDGFAIVTFATYKNYPAIGGRQYRIPLAAGKI